MLFTRQTPYCSGLFDRPAVAAHDVFQPFRATNVVSARTGQDARSALSAQRAKDRWKARMVDCWWNFPCSAGTKSPVSSPDKALLAMVAIMLDNSLVRISRKRRLLGKFVLFSQQGKYDYAAVTLNPLPCRRRKILPVKDHEKSRRGAV